VLGDPVRLEELSSDAIGRQVAVKWLAPDRKGSAWHQGTVQAYHAQTLRVKYEDGYEDDVAIQTEEVVWATERPATAAKERRESTERFTGPRRVGMIRLHKADTARTHEVADAQEKLAAAEAAQKREISTRKAAPEDSFHPVWYVALSLANLGLTSAGQIPACTSLHS
jgi:hypothetical protein